MTSVSDDRTIAHIDMDTFFVSVARLHNHALKNKPVLVGGSSCRSVVSSCSYEARKFGVRSAMPMEMAKRLCPEAIIVTGDHEQYRYHSDIITGIIDQHTPIYEKASIDEFYLDLSGMDRFFGCYRWATELRLKIQQKTGLPVSLGMSKNKLVSKVATGEAKPNGQRWIERGSEKAFLAPLAIGKIPMIGEKTTRLLIARGIDRVQSLQEMPAEQLKNWLGEKGVLIWERAHGVDHSPVVPHTDRKSISAEETFESDTEDGIMLKQVLMSMVEKLCFQMRKEGQQTSCITVKIRYAHFETHTMQQQISPTFCDHTLIKKANEIFDKLCRKNTPVRLVGLRLSHFVRSGYQGDLFENTEDMVHLFQAIDKVKERYGTNKIQRAAMMNVRHSKKF